MSQPVKLSDQLVLDARLTSELADRSIAGQIEFWAKLGRAIEPLLQGTQVLALRRAGEVKPLSACIEAIESPEGRRLLSEHLDTQPFPHYEQAPGRPGFLVRVDAQWQAHRRAVHQPSIQGRALNEFPWLDERPIIVALAGPNGAGKTTFYHAYLKPAGLRFVNADVLAHGLDLEAYAAARAADALRRALVRIRESFVFETVFSDPVGDKLSFLKEAAASGYNVVLLYIGLAGPKVSEQRVAMRVSQGGHDVPTEKLKSRYSRTLTNLKAAIRILPQVLVFDNGDLSRPFRRVAVFERGRLVQRASSLPGWLKPLLDR